MPANPVWILFHSWPSGLDRFIFRDIVVNVALYVPAGFTGHSAFRACGRWWVNLAAPVAVCAVWSASIELIQLFVPSRNCSTLDLLTNIAGALAGVLLGLMVEELLPGGLVLTSARKQQDRVALVLAGCWVVSLLFPLFPAMGRTSLLQKWSVFTDLPWDVVPLISAVAAWFVLGSLYEAGGVRSPRFVTAASVLLIPAQFFVVDRQPAPSELVGATAGALGFALLRPGSLGGRRKCRVVLAWAFLALLVIRGLAPFRFNAGSAPFSWVPFSGFLGMDWQTGIQVFLVKVFWYSSAVWLITTAGWRRGTSVAVVTAVLLGIEIVQTHIPGRVPEITDPLLAILAGSAMAMPGRAKRRPEPQAASPAAP